MLQWFQKGFKEGFACNIANILDEPFLTGEVYDFFSKGDAVTDGAIYLIWCRPLPFKRKTDFVGLVPKGLRVQYSKRKIIGL